MTQDTVTITDEIRNSEEQGIRIEYYTLDGKHPELYMCPGDLMLICNVLHDYASLLEEWIEHCPEEVSKFIYEYHANRCRKIQTKIENEMGYNTAAAIVKCQKRRNRKSEDIGEDALVLAAKYRRENPIEVKQVETVEVKQEPKNKGEIAGQFSILDFIK